MGCSGLKRVLTVNGETSGRQRLMRFGSSLFHHRGAGDDGCAPLDINKKDRLLIGVFQRPAGAQNCHDDYSLAKIRLIA